MRGASRRKEVYPNAVYDLLVPFINSVVTIGATIICVLNREDFHVVQKVL